MNTNNKEIKTKTDVKKSYIDENIEFQEDLYTMLVDDDFDIDKWIDKFNKYKEKYSRFIYSYITQHIFEEESDQKIEKLLGYINVIIEKISKTNTFSTYLPYLFK